MGNHHIPYPLGVTLPEPGTAEPATAAVFAAHATAMELVVFDPTTGRVRSEHELPSQTSGVWCGQVPGLIEGDAYGLRVHGPWAPELGMRHNPNKLLIDPYARLIGGEIHWGQAIFGHEVDASGHPVDAELSPGGTLRLDVTPNLGKAPYGVATRTPTADQTLRPRTPWQDTVVYEAHLRGLTMTHPAVPEEIRGTWAGLSHPAVVEHLVRLGVSAVELLPVFAIGDEAHLARRGMHNYWGYNTLGFFAPELRYVSPRARDAGPAAVFEEIQQAIETLHLAGLEVWLDVVYNHTCEGGMEGPLFSWRGLDAASYYRLDHAGRHVDVTGCGNTLDFSHPRVVQVAMDSLRYWVSAFGVDGYRFDLAPALARRGGSQGDSYDPDHPFLVAARTDPTLADVKLVAEPWDLGTHGWRTGNFPPPFAEWNDHFRDGVRTFWLSDASATHQGATPGDARDLATRLAGSADLFNVAASADRVVRDVQSSVNFITAHDGFTLADLTAYNVKHNQANGEGNRDGSSHNRSWNHGVEGPTDDPTIQESRGRTVRAMLGTLLISAGTPMLLAGDEFGRTQQGNNNAYCQDNELVWLDWQTADQGLLEQTRALIALRKEYQVLRQRQSFADRPLSDNGIRDLTWFGPLGLEMDVAAWHNPQVRTLQMLLHGGRLGEASVLAVLHAGQQATLRLPGTPWAQRYSLLWSSVPSQPIVAGSVSVPAGGELSVPHRGVLLFEVQ